MGMQFNRRRGTKKWMVDPGNPWPVVVFWLILAAGIIRLIMEIIKFLMLAQS